MSNKEEACGARQSKGVPGVKGMSGADIKKFIQASGTDAARTALSGKVKSRGEMCVILHSFRAGRELIAASGARSNFRLTPSPRTSPRHSPRHSPNQPVHFVAPVNMTPAQEKKYWSTAPKLKRTVSPNMRTNMERELNNFIKRLQNNKEMKNALSGNKPPKREKSYVQYGVRILGKRPTGEQIREALKRKSGIVGKKNNSSPGSSNNNVRSVRGERSEHGSSASKGSSTNKSSNSSSSSGRNSNSGSNGGSNNGGSNKGNGINRSHYQNLTAKRNKVVKVKNTSSRFTKKKKGFVVSGPFCLLHPTTKSCRAAMKYPGFFRRKLGKGRGVQSLTKHVGTKTKKVVFMKMKAVGGTKTARIPTKSRPGSYFTHGSRSIPTKTQLRMANNERWRRYETLVKNIPTGNLSNRAMKEANENKRSQLANRLMREALVNVMAGKVAERPRRLMVKRNRQSKPVHSELSKIFQKSYMTGNQLETYYKPPKKGKKNSSSSSGSSSKSGKSSSSSSSASN